MDDASSQNLLRHLQSVRQHFPCVFDRRLERVGLIQHAYVHRGHGFYVVQFRDEAGSRLLLYVADDDEAVPPSVASATCARSAGSANELVTHKTALRLLAESSPQADDDERSLAIASVKVELALILPTALGNADYPRTLTRITAAARTLLEAEIAAVDGDTLLRLSSSIGSLNGIRRGRVLRFVGDALCLPDQARDPREQRTWSKELAVRLALLLQVSGELWRSAFIRQGLEPRFTGDVFRVSVTPTHGNTIAFEGLAQLR